MLSTLPVCADAVDDALQKKDNVVLYLYTPQCGYCKKFAPRFEKMTKLYDKRFAFIKMNAYTKEGCSLMKMYNGSYVPYVLMIKSNKVMRIPAVCLMDNACFENELKNF